MTENVVNSRVQAKPPESPSSSGCLSAGLLFFIIFWSLIVSWVGQSVSWLLEQQIFEGSLKSPDLRWLVVLIFGLSVIIPMVIILLAVRDLPYRGVYRALAWAGGFALLLAPARLPGVTASLEAGLLIILGAALFLLVFRLAERRSPTIHASPEGVWLALLVGGLVGLPWLTWGALGSAWDTMLALLSSLLFGISASRVLDLIFREGASQERPLGLFLRGLFAALALLVMVTGLGVNGSQGLLSLAVPVLGWLFAALTPAPSDPAIAPMAFISRRRAVAMLAFLASFWPLAFIDPDELSAVISLGVGELIQWANTAAGVSFLIALILTFLVVIFRKWLNRSRSVVGFAVAALVLLVGAALYYLVGQPGLYGERLFVILDQQADLSAAVTYEDVNERRAFVYHTLVNQADTSQARLRGALDGWRVAYTPYYLQNAIEVQGGPLLRFWLARQPEVDRVLDSPVLRPLPAAVPASTGPVPPPVGVPWNLSMIGADRVWSDLGVTGAGVIVGQSDSGAQGDHPELEDSYRGRDGKNDYNWFDPWNASPQPVDIGGHGTHTLGTVLGNSVGVAPDAEWIGCVNLARNLGNPALYLDCMQFMLAPFPQGGDPLRDGRPELGAMVLNNSWGCPEVEGCDPEALLAAASALRAAGIFVVASAGNEGMGGCSTVSSPIALYDPVYSVGAVGQNGVLAPFSSTGPVTADESGRIKPDIAAPGVDVLSAFPGSTYNASSGTSMAGPHVAGVVALMWSANPDLIGDIEQTEQILNETARAYTGPLPECIAPGSPNNAVGYGIVDAYAAVLRAMGR